MKKTITINISGTIFHIEEDAYQSLQNYLNEIVRYFSTYEDSVEIIQDIESRIAEILNEKISASKQAVNLNDVNGLIKTMGTTKDFADAEADSEEPVAAESKTETNTENPKSRRLFRNGSNKMLGGVCSGIAHYLKADPMWIRLLFVVLFFGFAFFPAIPGFILLSYFVLWIVAPESTTLEEIETKTFYRDTENQTLAGVASGLAIYFAVDVVLVRLAFVVLLFLGGSGLILYLILWAIAPEAKTISDKIKMQGKPVTLSSIEENVKANLNIDPKKEETTLVKILLFPFRVLSTIFSKGGAMLGTILVFIFNLLRIAFGVFLILVSTIIMGSLIVVMLVYLGMISSSEYVQLGGLTLDVIYNTVPNFLPLSAFILTFIPMLAFSFFGVRILIKRRFIPYPVSIGLAIIWVVSIFSTIILAVPLANEFKEKEYVTIEKELEVEGEILNLKLNKNSSSTKNDGLISVDLQIVGYEGDKIRLEQSYSAYGKDEEAAVFNAKNILYSFSVSDSTIVLDRYFAFPGDGKLRGQSLKNKIYMPYGKRFIMHKDISKVIRNTVTPHGYREKDIREENTWFYDESGLNCENCLPNSRLETSGMSGKEISLSSFSKIEAENYFKLEIIQGNEHKIEILGDEELTDRVKIDLKDNTLSLDVSSTWFWKDQFEPIEVRVVLPELRKLELSGMSSATVQGFSGSYLKASIAGAGSLELYSNFDEIELELAGSSDAYLKGRGEKLTADLAGVCKLEAFEWEADQVEVEAAGASRAMVFGKEKLNLSASGASNINYKGSTVNLSISENGIGKVKRED